MNIIARPYGSNRCYCRPDTTWERENRDFYVPEGIDEIRWAPVVFVRISKAGKCIGQKFAERYYDSFNFGALMYCCKEADQIQESIAFTSCMDHTSILPSPLYNPIVMEGEHNVYEVSINGEQTFNSGTKEIKGLLEETLCIASKSTSLRIGDYVAVELAPVCTMAARAAGEVPAKARFCENELYDFKIIF